MSTEKDFFLRLILGLLLGVRDCSVESEGQTLLMTELSKLEFYPSQFFCL